MNMIPAKNVQYAAIAVFASSIIEDCLSRLGYTLPPDAATALPGVMAIIVAHVSDLLTGENKPCPPAIQNPGQKAP